MGDGGASSSWATSSPTIGATTSSSDASSSSAGGGASLGDAEWRPAPWRQVGCGLEVADNPVEAIHRVEWVPCEGGEAGCERRRNAPLRFEIGGHVARVTQSTAQTQFFLRQTGS